MKTILRRRIALLISIAVPVIAGTAIIVFIGGCAGASGYLRICDASTGRTYGAWPLADSGEFAIEFIHSVNQSPVRETYMAADEKIRPLSVRFYSYGAGMLSDLEGNRELGRDGDAMIISGFDTSFSKINLIVGTVSDHILYINDEIVSLRDLCGRNAHITIQYK